MPGMRQLACAGAVAAIGIGSVIVGCSDSVSGTAEANQAQAAAYRSEAASSSAAATSSKRAAAMDDNCGGFAARTNPSIDAKNAFVDSANNEAPDVKAKAAAASAELRKGADAVDDAVRDAGGALNSDIQQRIGAYSATARALADQIDRFTGTPDAVNNAISQWSGALNAVRQGCGL